MSEPMGALQGHSWLRRTMPGTTGCLFGFARWRGWLYLGYVFATFFLVGGVVDAGATFATANELKAALQKIRDSGAPLSCAEAAPPMIPADQNAAPLYLQVHDLISPRLHKGSGSPTETGMFHRPPEQPVGYGGADWSNPEDIKGLAELLKRDARALTLMDRAAAMPGCRFDIEWSKGFAMLFPHLAKLRAIARFCADATAVAAAQGDSAAAARHLRAGVAMACHATREPTLIAQLVAYACLAIVQRSAEYALSRCSLSEPDARYVLAILNSMDLGAGLATAMRTERAMVLDVYDMARRKPSDLAALMGENDGSGGRGGWAMWLYVRALPPLFNGDELAYVQYMERSIAAATAPWPESARLGKELETWAEEGLKRTIIARMVTPALSSIAARRFECQARANLLSGVLGLEVYKQRTGAYPESLEDLAGINWPVPGDPFGAGALMYKPQEERFSLYSIGSDGVDDGGKPRWKWGPHPPGPQPEDADKGDLPWQWR